MGNIAVSVENLGKRYFIGEKQTTQSFSLAETITAGFKEPFTAFKKLFAKKDLNAHITFWALDDVSFAVKHGDVLGIIGRNGAGKSTLLKILSRVLYPTTGRCVLYGRCGSLLEVGMGFHPELTGRENVYLNGAIIGLKKAEIDKKFDAIVDFSGIEKFIDTPVKHYSSGMYVRLAFSVAAQLDPEILIIDEVLAVGDLEFSKKCLKRMHDIAGEGRTVIFVSHSVDSLGDFCNKAIFLNGGRLLVHGKVDDVVNQYLEAVSEGTSQAFKVEKLEDIPQVVAGLPPDPVFKLRDICILQDSTPTLHVCKDKPVEVKIEYDVLKEALGLHVFFRLLNHQGIVLFESLNNGNGPVLPATAPGRYVSKGKMSADFLMEGPYELAVGAEIYEQRSCVPDMIKVALTVTGSGTVPGAYPNRRAHGIISPPVRWEEEKTYIS